MNIGIDARLLGKGYGLGRYIETLVSYLPEIASQHRFVVFLRRDNWDLVTDPRVVKVLADIPWYGFREQTEWPRVIEKESIDLMHFPHFNVPLRYSHPFVTTIHDLTMWHYPRPEATTHGRLVFALKDQVHRRVVRHAVKSAAQVIVPNEFTKDDVVRTLGVAGDHLTVVYEAPHTAVFASDLSVVQNFFDTHALMRPYALYVGAMYPHKNIPGLIRAWQAYQEKYGETHDLILVGKPDYFSKRLQAQFGAVPGVRWLGFVPDDILSGLYARSSLVVVPSLYEGFGLPPLEAFAHGVPVVSSNRACLPEVLGTGALYTDPESSEQFAEMIHLALSDEGIRQELKINAREELKRYSPEDMASGTVMVYEKALQIAKK